MADRCTVHDLAVGAAHAVCNRCLLVVPLNDIPAPRIDLTRVITATPAPTPTPAVVERPAGAVVEPRAVPQSNGARRPTVLTDFNCPDCGRSFDTPQAKGAHRRREHPIGSTRIERPQPATTTLLRPVDDIDANCTDDHDDDDEPIVLADIDLPQLELIDPPPEGVCAVVGCGTILSRYGNGPCCALHEQAFQRTNGRR